jgi:capsular polysaccharide biosynthesis protein
MEGLFVKDYDIISVNEAQSLENDQIVFNLTLQESQESVLDEVKKSSSKASKLINVSNNDRILTAE